MCTRWTDRQTLYSFAGVGLRKGTKTDLVSFVLKSSKAVDRWKRAKALVIDEISNGELFDNLEFRNVNCEGDNTSPWGSK